MRIYQQQLLSRSVFFLIMPTPPISSAPSVLRRSPRFAQNESMLSDEVETVSRRLMFGISDNCEENRLSSCDRALPRTNPRRVQLHSSLEPVEIPSSVNVHLASAEIPSSVDGTARGSASLVQSSEDAPATVGRNSPSDDSQVGARRNSPRGAVVIRDIQNDEVIRALQANDPTGAYNFLLRCSVKDLRKLSKDMNLKQAGKKDVLVARIFISIDVQVSSGKSLFETMSSHHLTAKFESWLEHQRTLDERSPTYWAAMPSIPDMLDRLEAREAQTFRRRTLDVGRTQEGEPGNGANREANRQEIEPMVSSITESTNFSISEFARLCIILRDDEDAKAALIGTGQELTRSQIDAGFSRDSLWGVIESRYNEPSLRLHLNLVGNVDDADSTVIPPCHRSASFLKDKFMEARASFTACIQRWSQSGQNNTDFENFAGKRDGVLTASGKRNLVLFVCTRMGTENQDTRFANICSRIIPFGRGYEEGGSVQANGQNSVAPGSQPPRNARRSSAGDNESAMDNSIAQFTEEIRQRELSREEERRARDVENEEWRREKIQDMREKREIRREEQNRKRQRDEERREARRMRQSSTYMRQIEEKQVLISFLKEMHESLKSQGLDPGTEFEAAARKQQELLFRAFSMPDNTPEGLPCVMPMPDEGGNRQPETQECQSAEEASELQEDEIMPNNP